ncbi:hypothetical protein ACOME3_003430 [Neoechinorhynchus agilis]
MMIFFFLAGLCECRWYYDRANYTLFRTNQRVDTSKARFVDAQGNFNQLSHDRKLVRLIDYGNGKKKYQGCNRNTRRCKERAYFDTTYNIRINLPPCCRRNLVSAYRNVYRLLERFGFTYSLYGGGVLAAYRDNGTQIPYDDDIDFIVDLSQYDYFMQVAKPILERKGRYVKDVRYRKQTHVQVSKKNRLSVDIFWFIDRGSIIDTQYANRIYDKSVIFPTKTIYFEGRYPQGPAKVYDYLKIRYNHWYWPLDCSLRRGHNCIGRPIPKSIL